MTMDIDHAFRLAYDDLKVLSKNNLHRQVTLALVNEILILRARLAPAGTIGDDDLPVHLPITVTEDGQGPADTSEAFMTVCWCADPVCTKFYGLITR